MDTTKRTQSRYHYWPTPGYLAIPEGVIGYIEVHDTENNIRDVYYQPTTEVVRQMCEQYGFDVDYTLGLISDRRRDAYAFVFIVDLYKKHVQEVKNG